MRRDLRDRVVGQRHDGLVDEVVAVGHVDGLGALGLYETWLMSKSNVLGPGLYELSNGTYVHATWSLVKPSWSAIAYATALSKPWPLVGSPSSHGAVLLPSAFSAKYGG